MTKANPGNFFEDFRIGREIRHATPRTVTTGDVALYCGLYGNRFAVQSSDVFAAAIGYDRSPVDDMLVFHMVFGKTVPDISLNALANLGYAQGVFGAPVFPGDTIRTKSTVIGLRENSSGKTGVVHVRSVGVNQRRQKVIDYVRWVMVRKRDEEALAPDPATPELAEIVSPKDLVPPKGLDMSFYDPVLAGSPHFWEDYEIGEKIDHVDGMTIEESDHMLATRLYQNTAKVHFNAHAESRGRMGRRIVYGGHVISLARCLSFNGLGNAFKIAAINGGRHVAPTFAGHTIHAWSEVLDKRELSGAGDLGALRLRLVATKDRSCETFPFKTEEGDYDESVVLDFDIWAVMPKRV